MIVPYTVVTGDTLAAIASAFGVTIAQMLSANPSITNPDLIYVGQVLSIPDSGSVATPAASALASKGALTQSVVVLPASPPPAGIMGGVTSLLQDKKKLITILAIAGAVYYFMTMKSGRKQSVMNKYA